MRNSSAFALCSVALMVGVFAGVNTPFRKEAPIGPPVECTVSHNLAPPDVGDLLARLRPVAKDGGHWFDSGVELTFYLRDVRVTVKTKDGNEYRGDGPDLRTAVGNMLGASDLVRGALDGWR